MNRPTILIVDDEQKFLKSFSLLLKNDFEVLTALNGKEGLSIYKANSSVSLILLDLDMPVMNGIKMLESLREYGDNVKVLIVTGKSTHNEAIRCVNLNVQGYIQKPFESDALKEKINKLLGITECKVLKELWGKEYLPRMNSASEFIKKTISYIKINIHIDFKRSDLSEHMQISPDYLSRIFHYECGLHLQQYINRCRIEQSLEYLESSSRRITEIAGLVGFQNGNYFARIFKQYKGVSPAEYKKIYIGI